MAARDAGRGEHLVVEAAGIVAGGEGITGRGPAWRDETEHLGRSRANAVPSGGVAASEEIARTAPKGWARDARSGGTGRVPPLASEGRHPGRCYGRTPPATRSRKSSASERKGTVCPSIEFRNSIRLASCPAFSVVAIVAGGTPRR